MLKEPEAIAAVRKEAEGLAKAGTWNLDTVQELESVKAKAKKSGESIHVGAL